MAGTLWALVHAHNSNYRQGIISSWKEAKQSYKSIKDATRYINDLYGRRISLTLVMITLYYAVTYGRTLSWKEDAFRVLVAAVDISFLIVVADIPYQVWL